MMYQPNSFPPMPPTKGYTTEIKYTGEHIPMSDVTCTTDPTFIDIVKDLHTNLTSIDGKINLITKELLGEEVKQPDNTNPTSIIMALALDVQLSNCILSKIDNLIMRVCG